MRYSMRVDKIDGKDKVTVLASEMYGSSIRELVLMLDVYLGEHELKVLKILDTWNDGPDVVKMICEMRLNDGEETLAELVFVDNKTVPTLREMIDHQKSMIEMVTLTKS